MLLPPARGPLSQWIVDALSEPVRSLPAMPSPSPLLDPLSDDDLHLALWLGYELHYLGYEGVCDGWEWNVDLLAARERLETCFLDGLTAAAPVGEVRPEHVAAELAHRAAADDGPQLARYLQTKADLGQFREFVAHRSVYHLKEADPHTWAIPRLTGPAKAALIEIQIDEYGGGRPERMHAQLFADLMVELDLNPQHGYYVARVPGFALAPSNLMSMFGLKRRWRGAIAGHLAALELTSSAPNRRYARGLRRLGLDGTACRFYDEHVEADAVHEQIAMHDLCANLARAEPTLANDIVFGAATALLLDDVFADRVLIRWGSGRSSLDELTMSAA